VLWRVARDGSAPRDLDWSGGGRRLLVADSRSAVVYDRRGSVLYELGPGAAPTRAAALAPNGRRLVFAQEAGGRTQLWVVPRIRPDASSARRLFGGAGSFDQVTWSPEGDWALATWSEPDQWVFVRPDGAGIRAVSNVSEQFRSRTFPRVDGWCCPGS
jgi:Tol biopolymer transport system component